MSALDKALQAKAALKAAEAEGTVKGQPAHEAALEKGIPVAKAIRVKRLILSNGNVVLPTQEGYFIALTEEIAEQLNYFNKSYGLVEIILPEDKK